MNQMKTLLACCFLACCLCSQLTAQVDAANDKYKQAYILYNNYPFFANIGPSGDILALVRTAPEIMKTASFDYKLKPPINPEDYVYQKPKLAVYNSPKNTTVVGDVTVSNKERDEDPVVQDKEKDKVKQVPSKPAQAKEVLVQKEEVKQDKAPDMVVKDQVVLVSDTKKPATVKGTTTVIKNVPTNVKEENLPSRSGKLDIGSQVDILFQGFSARLTPKIILQLEDVVAFHKSKPNSLVKIYSFTTANDQTNKKLALNRLDSCRKLLETYGVPSDHIFTDIKPYSSAQKGNVVVELEKAEQ